MGMMCLHVINTNIIPDTILFGVSVKLHNPGSPAQVRIGQRSMGQKWIFTE